MRHEKAGALLELARSLASSAEGLTLDEMAGLLGVGRRTAERMRDALYDLFPAMEAIEDGPVRRFRITGGLDGIFQSPSAEELLELNMAAASLRGAGAEPRAKVLEGLERKVRSAMRSAALRKIVPDLEALVRAEAIAVQAGPRPFEDEALIASLRHALMAMKAIRFAYLGGSTPGSYRTVAPYGLMFGRANYLVAAEVGSGEPRNWRLDRVRSLQVLETPAAPPEDFSLQDYANRSFGIYQDQVEDVVLRVMPHGADDALGWRFHASQTTTLQPDGSVIVTFQASGMLELAWHLFTWGDRVEVLQPERLRTTLIRELQSALAWHQTSARTAAPA
ncbi:MAG TPA: WYL domain-containing protein [Caulobacteraceae bacterium]|jgi:predicted DNA-binding transcriptional regulator YafY|nr:WYL domain-containing protein [Caulobacteraceae bacterium]